MEKKEMKVVIVGGVAGGASTAARLRRLNEQAQIILLERGEYISYANCGLPYYVGGVIQDKQNLTLQTPESFSSRFGVDVRVGNEAISVNPENKTLLIRNSTGEYTESYDVLVLSPGAEPVKPKLPGIDDKRIFSLRTIPDTFAIKKHVEENSIKTAVVVGGGFIGLEMAENLNELGVDVTVVELADQLFTLFDFDMACELHQHMRSKGIQLCLKTEIKGFVSSNECLSVETSNGSLSVDMVIMAIGVRPDSKLAADCGIDLGISGSIIVDEHMKTSVQDIYAVGDAVEVKNFVTGDKAVIPLAGPANKQGRIAADNICGISSAYKGTQGSSILKMFDKTAASTGINEKVAKAKGIDYDKVFLLPMSHATYYPGAKIINMKLLFDKTSGRVLGAQLFGEDGVDKRCDVIATAIRAGMMVSDLTELELCYAPPYSSAKDPVNMAGYVASNVVDGIVKQYHWHDVKGIVGNSDVQIVDVRSKYEVDRLGCFDGAINIPVDEIRNNDRLASKLDKSKPVYINCESGLRSYIASRQLSQLGYDVYNLSGGHYKYRQVMKELAL